MFKWFCWCLQSRITSFCSCLQSYCHNPRQGQVQIPSHKSKSKSSTSPSQVKSKFQVTSPSQVHVCLKSKSRFKVKFIVQTLKKVCNYSFQLCFQSKDSQLMPAKQCCLTCQNMKSHVSVVSIIWTTRIHSRIRGSRNTSFSVQWGWRKEHFRTLDTRTELS